MNQERFDELTKAFATTRLSRGQVLKALGAGLVVGMLPSFGVKQTQAQDAANEWSKIVSMTGDATTTWLTDYDDGAGFSRERIATATSPSLTFRLFSVDNEGTSDEERWYLGRGTTTGSYDEKVARSSPDCPYEYNENGSGTCEWCNDSWQEWFELRVKPYKGIYFVDMGASFAVDTTWEQSDCTGTEKGTSYQYVSHLSYDNDDEANWHPLPGGTTISGSDSTGSKTNYWGQWTGSWNLVGEPCGPDSGQLSAAATVCSDLKAKPVVKSKNVVRGGDATLDGSKSTGKIKSYTWKFGPSASGGCPDGVQPLSSAKKTGSKIAVKALCSFKATLTVSDGTNEHSASIEVTVNPRQKWETSFKHSKKEEPFTSAAPLTLGVGCQCAFGRNVCTLDGLKGDQSSGHWIHKEPTTIGWEGEGYTVAQLQDFGGPFDGYWYVAENKLRVLRTSLIHPDLDRTSETYKTNVAAGHKRDIALLAGSVRAHELINYIGTDKNGTADLGNSREGVFINASGNTVGGTSAEERNLISGNDASGVTIFGPDAKGNQVIGNYIGTDVTGTLDLGNSREGVFVDASGNSIGGTSAGARNVISGNDLNGVHLRALATPDAASNQVQGNYIGTDKSGTQDLGNTRDGVSIENTSDNTVGGTIAGARNIISCNNSSGVGVTGSASTGNRILSNSIFSNDGLGIDLNEDGKSANDQDDPDTGPNNLQNFPVLTEVKVSKKTGTTVGGTLNSTPGATFTLQFFAGPSGDEEGKRYLGSNSVTTDSGGDASFTFKTGKKASGEVTATATNDATGDTSEFSVAIAVQ